MKNTPQKNHTPSSSCRIETPQAMENTPQNPQAMENTPQKNHTPPSSDPNDHPMLMSPVVMMSMDLFAIN
jgi:hypothetical protein